MNTEDDTLTEEERNLLNDESMTDEADRAFCGIELLPITAISQRYVQRQLTALRSINYSNDEKALAYAFILTLKVDRLRKICRSIDDFEVSMDAWLATLPQPIPTADLENLYRIVESDRRQIDAASFEVKPKPGQAAESESLPNS